MNDFIAAFGIALILEGMVYALFAGAMKRTISHLLAAPDEALRIIGLLSAMAGLFIVWNVRG